MSVLNAINEIKKKDKIKQTTPQVKKPKTTQTPQPQQHKLTPQQIAGLQQMKQSKQAEITKKTTQPPVKTTTPKVPYGTKGNLKTPTGENIPRIVNPIAAGITKVATFGTSSLLPGMKEAEQQSAKQFPISYGIGQGLGYIAPTGLAKGVTTGLVKGASKKIVSEIGKNVAEGAIIGTGAEATQIVKPLLTGEMTPTQAGKQLATGLVAGAGIDVGIGLIGKLAKPIANKIMSGKALTQGEKIVVAKTAKVPVSEVDEVLRQATIKQATKAIEPSKLKGIATEMEQPIVKPLVQSTEPSVVKPFADVEMKPIVGKPKQPKQYFTGSSNPEIKTFVPGGDGSTKVSGDSYGKGVYLTSNPDVAKSYAQGEKGKVYNIEFENPVLDLDEKSNEKFVDTVYESLINSDKQYRNRIIKEIPYTETSFDTANEAIKYYDEMKNLWEKEDGVYEANKPEPEKVGNKFVVKHKDFKTDLKTNLSNMTNREIFESISKINTDSATDLVMQSGFDGIEFLDSGAFQSGIEGKTAVIYRNTDKFKVDQPSKTTTQATKSPTQIVKPLVSKSDFEVAETPIVKPIKSIAEDMGEIPSSKMEIKLGEPDGVDTKLIDDVIVKAPSFNDVKPTKRYTTDVYRNFETVFGKNTPSFNAVKTQVLDKFDDAKGSMVDDVKKYTDELENISKTYGINKKSKESKYLMRYGENRIDEDGLVKALGKEKANKVIEAEKWFRKTYDDLLDQVNESRHSINKDPIPKRDDYFRHYNEIANTFESIKNILEGSAKIDPKLMGLSEFTKPREAWASFKQKRTDGSKFTEDAVGGMIDYIKASTYAKHIDPQISNFRTFRTNLANATEGTKNLNNFIEYLDDFTNDLSGKTNPFDRTLQKALGRTGMSLLNTVNSRVKANAVLGNLSSSLAQIANVPQAVATIKDPAVLAKGFKTLVNSIGDDKPIYDMSTFLKERYIQDAYSKFDKRIIDQPQKVAAWLLGALDEVGTKFTWSSAYQKAVKEGIENPVRYADDLTRKLVAGRGIGEVPLLQKSNTFQLIAPFTTEVNNMWKVMGDMVSEKDLAGLGMFFALNYGLNKGMESIRGSDVTYDPIDAIINGYDEDKSFGDNFVGVTGSLAGETLSNMPMGSALASVYPEYGTSIGDYKLPSRADLFGESDPTRYGVSVPIVKALQDPLKNLALPFGGGQIAKTVKGAQTMGLLPQNVLTEKDTMTSEKIPASVSKSGKIRTLVEPTPVKTAQALAFGGYASPEVRTFFEGSGVPFGESQTPNIIKLINSGIDPKKLQIALTNGRNVKTKEERLQILIRSGFNKEEIEKIMSTYYGYKR